MNENKHFLIFPSEKIFLIIFFSLTIFRIACKKLHGAQPISITEKSAFIKSNLS